MALPLTRRRFTVSEYYRMAESGILTEDDRVELIHGEIVEMAPIGRRHAAGVDRVADLFFHRFADGAIIRVQNPVRLDEYSEPEPDVALLRRCADYYEAGHPTPADVLLLVEIADTSTAADRQVKIPLYARSGIPEVWLVGLNEDTIGVYPEFIDGYGVLILPTTGRYMHVPYRSMLPKGVKNLLVAGRAIGGDRIAHAATRNMSCCAVAGQGAGVAAAISVKAGSDFDRVDMPAVQRELERQGVRIY